LRLRFANGDENRVFSSDCPDDFGNRCGVYVNRDCGSAAGFGPGDY